MQFFYLFSPIVIVTILFLLLVTVIVLITKFIFKKKDF